MIKPKRKSLVQNVSNHLNGFILRFIESIFYTYILRDILYNNRNYKSVEVDIPLRRSGTVRVLIRERPESNVIEEKFLQLRGRVECEIEWDPIDLRMRACRGTCCTRGVVSPTSPAVYQSEEITARCCV